MNTQQSKESELYPRYRYVMGTITIPCAALTYLALLITTPMLVFFSEAFAVDIATAGYVTTLHVMAMGIFMFVGPVLIGAIDIKRTQLLGVGVMIAGLLLAWAAPSFPVLLAARLITGAGHGISGSCTNSVIADWFPPKEKSVMITINNLGLAAMGTLGYAVAVPLYHGLGDSWRGIMLIMLLILVAVEFSWIIWGRDNAAMRAQIMAQNASVGKTANAFTGIHEAITRRDSWCLCLYMGLASVGATGISTYLPQFLQNVRGYSDAGASAIVGLTTGIGAAGTFLGGIAATAIGRRKPIILPFMLTAGLFAALMLLSKGHWLISLFLFLYIFSTNFRSTASWTVATELRDVTPALASAVSAMIYGVGNIFTLAVPAVYGFALNAFGAERSMLVFLPAFLLALVFALLLPETGKRPLRGKKDR